MADPNLLSYMGKVAIAQLKFYYEPLTKKAAEQAQDIKDNRGTGGLSHCNTCFCVAKTSLTVKSATNRIAVFACTAACAKSARLPAAHPVARCVSTRQNPKRSA